MSVFYHEEQSHPHKRCRCIFKEVFSHCHKLGRRVPASSPQEEYVTEEVNDEEQEEIVSAIRSKAMEKLKQKPHFMTDGLSVMFYPPFGNLYILPKEAQKKDGHHEDVDNNEEFLSVRSCFSCCSNAATEEAFLSANTNFSRGSSLNEFQFQELHKRSILQQFCHCEGWPFGLYRKLILLPPLPKSPSESWSWRKGTKNTKTQQV